MDFDCSSCSIQCCVGSFSWLLFCSEFKRCRCCCLGPYASGLFCIQLVLSMPLMCWLPGCVFKAIGWNRDAWGSSCFWSQLGYPAACNWDKTLAASPREILRSINKLQTQLNRGGLAGFEFSRLCKSISSCFVLIPRKASISMSSPVWASIVRWAVLVICQRPMSLCSATFWLEFATLVSLLNQLLLCLRFWIELSKQLFQSLQAFWGFSCQASWLLLLRFSLLFRQLFQGVSCSIQLVWSLWADPVNGTRWIDAPVPGQILDAFVFAPHPTEHINESTAVSDGVDVGEGLKFARNVHCDSDYCHARCLQFGNGCLVGPHQLQAVLFPPSTISFPSQHVDPDCKQGPNGDHDHQELTDHQLSYFWIHRFCSLGLAPCH